VGRAIAAEHDVAVAHERDAPALAHAVLVDLELDLDDATERSAKNPPTTTTAIAARLPSMKRATAEAVLGARGPVAVEAVITLAPRVTQWDALPFPWRSTRRPD
jgi:hypothetical protein